MKEIYIVSINNINMCAFGSEGDANEFAEYIEESTEDEVNVDSLVFDTFHWENFIV